MRGKLGVVSLFSRNLSSDHAKQAISPVNDWDIKKDDQGCKYTMINNEKVLIPDLFLYLEETLPLHHPLHQFDETPVVCETPNESNKQWIMGKDHVEPNEH